ncbi:DUF881 domain-containing protein [Salipaludibacillus sp. CUR1]|uniref:DUF881 domain-containing protein n=1 Tax=Salipaludibacillus sp. CUR1 TaxID=2820003 RepID=UPI001E33F10C|nr:DUF881 domain-containing protein [Salipaludibacillus sp. CUR1]MCE7794697.1 DUF881 domain-containing protein [Salipaludibacillus sp. CUR1]
MKLKGKYVIFSVVLLVTGFLMSLSYQMAGQSEREGYTMTDSQWQEEADLRNDVLREQQVNRELAGQLKDIQTEIKTVEEEISHRERTYFNLVEDLDHLRMVTGNVGVKGEGLSVTLTDADYIPGEDSPNNYIVHEHHLQQVIDELLVAGAEAVAVNGRRISHQSYIQCTGPVIEIDGETSFAPFEITAIGDRETLDESLNLAGGVKDQLVSENIQVRIERKNEVVINPYFEGGEDT